MDINFNINANARGQEFRHNPTCVQVKSLSYSSSIWSIPNYQL